MSDRNPTEKSCWMTCTSCYRCADKGRYSACATCSGRSDPFHRIDPDPDDYCDCHRGILRYRTRSGRLLIAPLPGNPFAGRVISSTQSADERDWDAYLQKERERRNDPTWSPILYDNEMGSEEWYDRHRRGIA